MPGKGSSGGHGAGLGNTPVNNFKPPPGFMDSPDDARHTVAEDPQKLLQKLKTGNGYWHELATALPALQRAGFDWLAIEADTGLERALQSIWTIAGQVFESLKQQANFPDEKLRYFNTEDSEYKLYPMRVLAVQARGPVAEYIVDHDLNTKVRSQFHPQYEKCRHCLASSIYLMRRDAERCIQDVLKTWQKGCRSAALHHDLMVMCACHLCTCRLYVSNCISATATA